MQPPAEEAAPSRSMIVTTTENIPDTRVVKTLGHVFGLTVRSRSLGGNIAAAFAYASDVSTPQQRTAALGLIGAAIGVGFTLGQPLGGLLAGADPAATIDKYRSRLVFLDYKDARWTEPSADLKFPNGKIYPKESHAAKFFSSIYDLGDGDVDFPACHRILKKLHYQGWICVDLDVARNGPKASYQRC